MSRVLDALSKAGLLTAEQIAVITEAASSSGANVGEVLVQRGLATPADVESALEEELGIPSVDLSSYAPDNEALRMVPEDLARTYNVLPLFEIENILTVAIGDPMDVFRLDDLSLALGLEIEAVLADTASVAAAIDQYYGTVSPVAGVADDKSVSDSLSAPDSLPVPDSLSASDSLSTPDNLVEYSAAPDDFFAEEPVIDTADFFEAPAASSFEAPTADSLDAPVVDSAPLAVEPFDEEQMTAASVEPVPTIKEVVETVVSADSPAIDLDVLAVADAGKVAVLVSDILAHAVSKGASRIHLLPYKEDFFLVYRIQGRLEKIASAPLSLQSALVDGIKAFARLSAVQSSSPALGRVKAHIADRDLVLTVSAVPTIAGQRVVVSIGNERPMPSGLPELGMNEAETRALHAMIERGRGILLVCAPVAGGRSATYYALLHHAAQAGKTVYSVERSVEYEIPAVAQVLVNPGSPIGAESYFAAGMRQDTDVMAIDPMQSVEDVHLAVEAAGLGKLVIAAFSGGDIVSGVRRMLDLGAEPVSLASALTLGVGQRLVRQNCPHCSVEVPSDALATLPGAPADLKAMKGMGCSACSNTGFQGVTGIFEVLPFTERVRAPIARAASAEEISAAARAAGMRPMVASGLAKVADGRVSPDELDRVLRLAQ